MEIRGVTETIVHHLRNQIITGELAPGQRLHEAELAAGLGVSRAPLREAFLTLEKDRLIVRAPRRGAYVEQMTSENLERLYQARTMIECFAIDIISEQGTRDFPALKTALVEAEDLAPPSPQNREGMLDFLLRLTDFHTALVKTARNDWMDRFYRSITHNMARYQYVCLFVPGLTSRSHDMHEKILSNLQQGDFASAKKSLISHIHDTVAFIKERLPEDRHAEPAAVVRS